MTLADAFARCRADATALAGEPGDIPGRVNALHALFHDSGGNHAFPQVALHGALWAYRFFETTGSLGKTLRFRYFHNPAEQQKRMAMLDGFCVGFKAANREVFIDTHSNYHFTRIHGEAPGAEEHVHPKLLEVLNKIHHARRRNTLLPRRERGQIFDTALRFEQEFTVGPAIEAEIARFDCPILTALCVKPLVRFAYFPSMRFFWFRDFSAKSERIEKAITAYRLAERVGWDKVIRTMSTYEVPGILIR